MSELSFVACAALVKFINISELQASLLRSGAQGKEDQKLEFLRRLRERTAQQLAEPAGTVVRTQA